MNDAFLVHELFDRKEQQDLARIGTEAAQRTKDQQEVQSCTTI